jgi:hypothetical protein
MTNEHFLRELDEFLDRGRIVHFSAREVAPVGRVNDSGIALAQPPRRLWPHILWTLNKLELARSHFGNQPVLVHSAWRDREYNRTLRPPGAERSLHLAFSAVDFHITGVPHRDVALWLHGEADGDVAGIGLYDRWVHYDLRGLLGRVAPARWPTRGPLAKWWR